MGCFSGHLMSSARDQKLFCEICSAFNCSFHEFVGEKVVSPSYSSAIFATRVSEQRVFQANRAKTTEHPQAKKKKKKNTQIYLDVDLTLLVKLDQNHRSKGKMQNYKIARKITQENI